MTLRADMIADAGSVIIADGGFEHEETVTYTPKGGSPVAISAIVDRMESVFPTFADGREQRVQVATVWIKSLLGDPLKGIADPKEQDTIIFDSKTWKVSEHPVDEGFGLHRLEVIRFVDVEVRSSDGRRRIG